MIASREARSFGWQPLSAVAALSIVLAATHHLVTAYGDGSGIRGLADFLLYRDATMRWLDGNSFYLPHQTAGPYLITFGDVLYPPPILLLLVPIALVPLAVAALAWWGIPVLIVAASLWRLRPAPWAWPLLALTLWWPATLDRLATGNPLIWLTAAVYLSAVVAGPSALILLKPTLAPFAFFRANNRQWGMAAAALALVSLPFIPMWFEYAAVLTNARSFAGLGYSLEEFPALAGAPIAFVARRSSATRLARTPTRSPVDA